MIGTAFRTIVFFITPHRPSSSPLFPYTTLFRSKRILSARGWRDTDHDGIRDRDGQRLEFHILVPSTSQTRKQYRSEEHTSELQSRLHLVCRRLLEKKNRPKRRNSQAFGGGCEAI